MVDGEARKWVVSECICETLVHDVDSYLVVVMVVVVVNGDGDSDVDGVGGGDGGGDGEWWCQTARGLPCWLLLGIVFNTSG